MAQPMTPAEMRAAFKKWNIPVRYLDGWDSPNSGRDDETGLAFGPVIGCVTHHTGDDAPDGADRALISNGRSDLPGPLAQFGCNDDGILDVHTCHRANHAGGGDPAVRLAVMHESYKKYPPPTHEHEGSSGAVDGNDCFYGMECYYSGGHKMTPKQYRTMILTWAAICDHYNWSEKSVIGHKEWSDWKPDPGSHDMAQVRMDVKQALKDGPRWPKEPEQHLQPNAVLMQEAKLYIQDAIKRLEKLPETRETAHDVANKLAIQLERLPK